MCKPRESSRILSNHTSTDHQNFAISKSLSLCYLYSNSSILDPPLGFLRCRCIAVTCTGRPALSAVWHVILTVPGMAHSVPGTFQLLRGKMRNPETLRSWPKMKKMLYELVHFTFFFFFFLHLKCYFISAVNLTKTIFHAFCHILVYTYTLSFFYVSTEHIITNLYDLSFMEQKRDV